MVMRQPHESQTRAYLIDTQLSQAGWSSNRRTLIEEYALYSKEADPLYGSEQFADYVLLNSHNEPLAIVEAKNSSRDALAGKRQAADYADLIEDRFAFALEFRPRDPEWSEAKLRQLLPWLEAAGEITGEPEPSRRRFLHFDLLGRLNQISDEETRKNLEGVVYQGDALLQLLNHYGEATAYERFERLHAMHQAGLFDHLQICLRKKDTEDLILYDELSDGEQMILGRMALFHLLKERSDALLLMDEPETHFNDVWKREIVDIVDDALGETASEVMIATHSAIVLTDAMSRDIVLLERNAQGHAEVRQIRSDLQTFGATSDHPLRDVFGSPDTVGKRATIILETLLAATENRREVERYWQGDAQGKSDLAGQLFNAIKRTQPNRREWKFDADDVATALDQTKQFARYYGVQAPFKLGSVISAFIDHMGPGYFKIELMRAWRKLRDNSQRDS